MQVCSGATHTPVNPPRSAAATPSDNPGNQPPAQWEAWAAAQLERERAIGLAEYSDLKDTLLQRLQRVSALLALYLLFVSSGEVRWKASPCFCHMLIADLHTAYMSTHAGCSVQHCWQRCKLGIPALAHARCGCSDGHRSHAHGRGGVDAAQPSEDAASCAGWLQV